MRLVVTGLLAILSCGLSGVPAWAADAAAPAVPPPAAASAVSDDHDILIEAIRGALCQGDTAVIGRLHEYDPLRQRGVVMIERQLKGDALTGTVEFFYPHFARDARQYDNGADEVTAMPNLHGVWILRLQTGGALEFTEVQYIALPAEIDPARIAAAAEAAAAGNLERFESYCESAAAATRVFTAALKSVTRVAGQPDSLEAPRYDVVLEHIEDLKTDEPETRTVTARVNAGVVEALLDSIYREPPTATGGDPLTPLLGIRGAWTLTVNETDMEHWNVIPLPTVEVEDDLHARLRQTVADADAAFERGEYRAAYRLYRRALHCGAKSEQRRHIRKRIEDIRRRGDICAASSTAGAILADR